MPGVSRETVGSLLPDGANLDQLEAYHDLLAGAGVTQGLIGPREASRLWDRHLGNSAWVVLPSPGLVPVGSSVADVGSGAGLPGIVWAIVRPDLTITLIEPLLRRSTFLTAAVADLGLDVRVEVVRDRAENLSGRLWDIVTARAVAPLSRLLGWTMPLVKPSGSLLALKGASAEMEIEDAKVQLKGCGRPRVELCGPDGADPTRVIAVPARPGGLG